MEKNRNIILDLNYDCQLQILKYIIADCELSDKSQDNKMKYVNLVNFSMAYEVFEVSLEKYYNNLYKDLEFVFVANRRELEIDFPELHATHSGEGEEAFWRMFADAIRENNVIKCVTFCFDLNYFQPNYWDHFEMVERALENKTSLLVLKLKVKGNSPEDPASYVINKAYISYPINENLEFIKHMIAYCDLKDKSPEYSLEDPALYLINRTNKQNMDENRKSILDLDTFSQLEILKYIIADCKLSDKSQDNEMKYANLVSYALAHYNIEAILEEYNNDLYKRLEFIFVANRSELEIDFSELLVTYPGKKGDAFWPLFAHAIKVNDVIEEVELSFFPEYFQSNFLDKFEIVKRALENKKSLKDVTIRLNGYSLEDLNNFGYITYLSLDVRMKADALVNICKSNPHLESLSFRSTEILGRLSDIVPHCCNLKKLEFVPKPDNDGAEYAPLAELPNLQKMTIFRAFENGSLLTLFEAITNWQRPEHQPLTMDFIEFLPHLSNVTIARMNSFSLLELKYQPQDDMALLISYDFWDISRDSSPLEQSLATITLIKAKLKIDCKGLTLSNCPASDTDISGFVSLLKAFDIKTFILGDKQDEIPIAKIFSSMIPDESYALKSIHTFCREVDQFDTSELVKIESITSLTCKFSDWESVELLSALTNLETVAIKVSEEFEQEYSTALCTLLNACSASGVIKFPDWCIEFRKNENNLSQNKIIKTLKIKGERKEASHIFEAFSNRDLITIEELDFSECLRLNIFDILKVAMAQPIKRLRISWANLHGFWNLSHLTKLEELALCNFDKESLIKFSDQLTASPPPQYPKKHSKFYHSSEIDVHRSIWNAMTNLRKRTDLFYRSDYDEDSNIDGLTLNSVKFLMQQLVSKNSLKKLDLCDTQLEDVVSLMELANSNIEELTLEPTEIYFDKLLSAFAEKSRIQRLKIKGKNRCLNRFELEDLTKINSLRSLQCKCLCNFAFLLRNFNHLVQLDIEFLGLYPEGIQYCLNLENLESLTLHFLEQKDVASYKKDYDILADIPNLKKLNLSVAKGVNLTKVYHAFASKNVKLTHLTTMIECVEELNEIIRIKSLKYLNLFLFPIKNNLTSLGELSELETLQITLSNWLYYTFDYDHALYCRVLSILKCCRNLNRLVIFSEIHAQANIQRVIETILKSTRDPNLQGPLTVIFIVVESEYKFPKYHIPEILVISFENAYFRVLTSLTSHR